MIRIIFALVVAFWAFTAYAQQINVTARPLPGMTGASALVDLSVGNADTPIVLSLPNGITRYRFNSMNIGGASGSLLGATFGVFTGPGATGATIVAAGTTSTVTTASDNTNLNAQNVSTVNTNTESFNAPIIYVRVGSTAAVTATFTAVIVPLAP